MAERRPVKPMDDGSSPSLGAMNCYKCGSTTDVKDSRIKETLKRRTRECANGRCRQRFNTFETDEDTYNQYVRIRSVITVFSELIQDLNPKFKQRDNDEG